MPLVVVDVSLCVGHQCVCGQDGLVVTVWDRKYAESFLKIPQHFDSPDILVDFIFYTAAMIPAL